MGKDVTINAVTAWANAGPPGLKPTDVQHHCPLCDRTMPFEEFMAHGRACAERHLAEGGSRGSGESTPV